MDYCTFVDAMMNLIDREVREGTTIKEHTVIKNNGKKRIGIVFQTPGINISPAIYMEEYYELYRQGVTMEMLASKIIRFYEEVKFQENFDNSAVCDFDNIKDRIVFQMINYERNEQRLCNMPYLMFHDLAICFQVLLDIGTEGMVSFGIEHAHLKLWNVDFEDVFKLALNNTPRLLEASFGSMDEVIDELKKGLSGFRQIPIDEQETEHLEGLYILTNHYNNNGAGVILYPHILEMIGEILEDDFYIIPSSIHEVIILSSQFGFCKEELEEIVCGINETQLEEEEVLSNSVYFFNRKTKRILY